MRKIISVVAMAVIMLSCCSCSGSNTTSKNYPVTEFDVTVKSCPQKIISLSPAVTEIIKALGSDAQLIGVSNDCTYDKKLKKYGTSLEPDINKIKKSGADLIFASASIPSDYAKKISSAGITLAKVSLPNSFSKLGETYDSVAALVSGAIAGPRNASNTFGRIKTAINKAGNSAKVNCAVFVSENTAVSAGTITTDLIETAGGKLISGSDKQIADKAPAMIICPPSMKDAFSARFPSIRIEEFDVTELGSCGNKMASKVSDFAALIHSEAAPSSDAASQNSSEDS